MRTQENLALKIGAQIMTVINDPGTVPSDDGVDQYTSKKFFNGSIGTILELHEDHIVISTESHEYIAVYRTTWTNISYRWHPERKTIVSEEIGAFTQIPVRLAWAITVHKSQGLTFDKVIADINDAFTNGQAYVALSRCTSLEGLVFKYLFNPRAIKTDPIVVYFSQYYDKKSQNEQDLLNGKADYFYKLARKAFFTYGFLECQECLRNAVGYRNDAQHPLFDKCKRIYLEWINQRELLLNDAQQQNLNTLKQYLKQELNIKI